MLTIFRRNGAATVEFSNIGNLKIRSLFPALHFSLRKIDDEALRPLTFADILANDDHDFPVIRVVGGASRFSHP